MKFIAPLSTAEKGLDYFGRQNNASISFFCVTCNTERRKAMREAGKVLKNIELQ
jgi:hypothetical protein